MKNDIRDFRIGNHVKCKIGNDGGLYTILALPNWGEDGLQAQSTVVIDRPNGWRQTVPIDKIRPLVATDGVLLWYGFKPAGDVYLNLNGGQMYLKKVKGGYQLAAQGLLIGQPMKYIHQIQNLYKELYQTELEKI